MGWTASRDRAGASVSRDRADDGSIPGRLRVKIKGVHFFHLTRLTVKMVEKKDMNLT